MLLHNVDAKEGISSLSSIVFSLTQSHRLNAKEIDALFKKGLTSKGSGMRIFYNVTTSERIGKLAFISAKACGNAVKRNMCKRRLKEIITCARSLMLPRYDVVLLAYPSILTVSFKKATKEALSLFKSCGLASNAV